VSEAARSAVGETKARAFPEGIDCVVALDTTEFVRIAIDEGDRHPARGGGAGGARSSTSSCTSWRTTVICLAAIAVSLVATFAGMLALGFSINPLTPVRSGAGHRPGGATTPSWCVENVERNMAEHHASSAREATVRCDAARSPGPWSRWCW
jgi:multidrug efflux pump